MSDICGRCGSTNLKASDHDLWHYMRDCKDCGARTRYNGKRRIVWVKGGDDSPKKDYDIPFRGITNDEFREQSKIIGRLEGRGSNKSIYNSFGRMAGVIDRYGNIKNSFGEITGNVDSFGNIKDSFGNIKGYIDNFGNFKKS